MAKDEVKHHSNFSELTRFLRVLDISTGARSSRKAPHRALQTPDILLQIFSLCLPSDITHPDGLAPLNFSQVCRTWREVTHASKSLWSDIVINPTEITNRNKEFQQLLKRYDYWSQRRTRGTPLSLECNFVWEQRNGVRRCLTQRKARELLNRLFSASESNPSSQICTSPPESADTFVLSSNMVGLKLGPMFHDEDDDDDIPDLALIVSKAANLRRLELEIPIYIATSENLRLPSLCIISLVARSRTMFSEIVALMKIAENLEQVKIAANVDSFNNEDVLLDGDGDSGQDRCIRLQRLRSLKITTTGTCPGVVAYILDRLAAPSIRALAVSFVVDQPSLWRSLTDFTKEFGADLKILHLNCMNPFYSGIPRDTDVLPVLECTESVEFLYLQGIVFTSLLAQAMNYNQSPEAAVVCPNLQTLSLEHGTVERTDFVGLSEMLSSRWHSPHSATKLSRVHLNFEDPRFETAVGYLREKKLYNGLVSFGDRGRTEREIEQRLQLELSLSCTAPRGQASLDPSS